MIKLWVVLAVLASFLFMGPVIESSTTTSLHLFQAVGHAESGGGE
jgi:hypothetical protein